MVVEQSFNQTVDYYDRWIKMALPRYDAIFSTALGLIPFGKEENIQVLDLGAGTGLFAQQVFELYPNANFVLFDLAEKMLNLARERFKDHADQFEYMLMDFRDMDSGRNYDLVISSLSIHHLSHEEKQTLFARVFKSLNSPGVFLNVDQIKGPSPLWEKRYKEDWLERVRAKGAEEELVQASLKRRGSHDVDALMVDQMKWLAAAGFQDVDCVFKDYFMGVFYGRKE